MLCVSFSPVLRQIMILLNNTDTVSGHTVSGLVLCVFEHTCYSLPCHMSHFPNGFNYTHNRCLQGRCPRWEMIEKTVTWESTEWGYMISRKKHQADKWVAVTCHKHWQELRQAGLIIYYRFNAWIYPSAARGTSGLHETVCYAYYYLIKPLFQAYKVLPDRHIVLSNYNTIINISTNMFLKS